MIFDLDQLRLGDYQKTCQNIISQDFSLIFKFPFLFPDTRRI